ncbi:MAG: hypothetical protein ACE14L_15480 [Terriglobales bacterium]
MDKVAPPFWLCFTVGMLLGQATGRFAFWLTLSGVVGLALGFVLRAIVRRRRLRAFRGTGRPVERYETPETPVVAAPQPPDIEQAA